MKLNSRNTSYGFGLLVMWSSYKVYVTRLSNSFYQLTLATTRAKVKSLASKTKKNTPEVTIPFESFVSDIHIVYAAYNTRNI